MMMMNNVKSNVTIKRAAFLLCMQEVLGKNRRYNGLRSLRFPSVQGMEEFKAYLKACEILQSMTMTIYSLVKFYQRFGGTHCFHMYLH